MNINNELVLGIATYQFNDWKELLSISEDSENLETTWDEWNNNIHKYEERLRKDHMPFKEILIELNELKDYCRKKGLQKNGESRSQFDIK